MDGVLCRISILIALSGASLLPANFTPKPCIESRSLTHSPIALSDIVVIKGIGNLNPPSHTFPSTHTYFYVPVVSVSADPGSGPFGGSSIPLQVPIYSPGDLTVKRISRVDVTF